MKMINLLATVAGLALLAGVVSAQNTPVVAAPSLAYGVPQVLRLSQAKVGDDTIIAYVRNFGNSYGLDADQIIYLRQQGVSDNVITTMLSQPKPAAAPAPAPTPAPAPAATQPDNTVATVYAPPTTTYGQSVPSSTVYVIPDTRAYFYNTYHTAPYIYPYYPSYYPGVSLSFGFGGSYRGGYYGGYYGGGYHGGGYGTYHGGWHH